MGLRHQNVALKPGAVFVTPANNGDVHLGVLYS